MRRQIPLVLLLVSGCTTRTDEKTVATTAAVPATSAVTVSGSSGQLPPECVIDEAAISRLPPGPRQDDERKRQESRRLMEIYEGGGCNPFGPPLQMTVARTTIFEGDDGVQSDLIVTNRIVLVRPGKPNVACWVGAISGDHRAVVRCRTANGDPKGYVIGAAVQLRAVGESEGQLVLRDANGQQFILDPTF